MALNYEVKKRVFGFDETKTEKYVAQMKTLGVVGFKDLCDEVSKIGMAPRGVVKLVLDGLIDTLNMDINKDFRYSWVSSAVSVPASTPRARTSWKM